MGQKKHLPKLRVFGGNSRKKPRLSKSELAYLQALHQIIDDIYKEAAANKWTWHELASKAVLSYLTVSNLGQRITRYPRYFTVYKLAKAVGWELKAKEIKAHKSKIKYAKAV